MIANVVGSVWTEPRAPRPPARVWRDWALVAVLASTAVLEASLRHDVTWRPFVALEAVALAFTLLWRRTHPLAVLATAFGVTIVMDVAAYAVNGVGEVGLYTMMYLLLLPYALLRWGSGREVVAGSVVLLSAFVVSITKEGAPLAVSIPGLWSCRFRP